MNCGDPSPIDNGNYVYISELHEPLYQATVQYFCKAPYYTLQNKEEGKCCVCYRNIYLMKGLRISTAIVMELGLYPIKSRL